MYRNYTINVELESSPINPFKEWDCEPPILVHFDRTFQGYGLDNCPPDLTADEIRAHATEIARMFGASSLLRALDRSPGYYEHGSATDAVNAAIMEHFEGLYVNDKLELIAAVYRWKGIPAEVFARTGYCQGDYTKILVVLTPEWCEKVGAVFDDPEPVMRSTADLYAAWAFGDVYGYTVENPDGDEIDGCWGFYGDDHEASGLMEQARDAVDCDIEYRRRAKQAQVKVWVAHRVPLEARQWVG